MNFRLTFGMAAIAASLIPATAPRAATITGSASAWSAGVGGTIGTTSNFSANPDCATTVSSIPVSYIGSTTVTLAGTGDTVCQPGANVIPFANGYTGQVLDTSATSGGAATETFTFSSPVNALAVTVTPDWALFASVTTDTFTVTLSDGTSAQISGSYAPDPLNGLASQFIGYFGGTGITSVTIAASNTADGDFFVGPIAAVPEPMSIGLLLTGLAGLGAARRRRA